MLDAGLPHGRSSVSATDRTAEATTPLARSSRNDPQAVFRAGGLRAIAALLTSVTTIALGAGLASAGTPSAPSGSCAPYVAVLVPGTWETNPTANPETPVGMLAPVGKQLKSDYGLSLDTKYVPYSASAFDKGLTYAQSQQSGKEAVNRILQQCAGSRFVIAGYSQGADIAGDVAADIGNGRGVVPAAQVLGVGLVADPKQGTAGAQTIGPKPAGQGISGVRPEGFGALSSVTKQICAPGDLYCSVSQGKDGLLSSLGKVLGAPAGGATATTALSPTSSAPAVAATSSAGQSGVAAPAPAAGSLSSSSLVSDYSSADLSGATSTAGMLRDKLSTLQNAPAPSSAAAAGDVASIGALAQQLVATFAPVQQTQQFISATPGVRQELTTAAPNTPMGQANSLLSQLGKVDVGGIVNNASSIASTLASVSGATTAQGTTSQTPSASAGSTTSILPSGSASPTAPTSTPNYSALTGTATQLAGQVAPVGSMPADALATASNILGTLKPATVINQALNVVSAVVDTDYQGIINSLATLPQQVFRGDVKGAHNTARMLNKQFEPWVKMAAQIDFHTAAQLVTFIPDTTGTTQIVSLVLGLLANVDIVRLARDVGQIQEVAWSVLETGNLLQLARLVPIGLDLASVGLGVLSPGAKLSPEQLDAAADPSQQSMAAAAAGNDLPGIASNLVSLAGSQGAQDLTSLIGQGLDAASFYASGTHTKYASMLVEGGKTALQWLVDFFRQQISG